MEPCAPDDHKKFLSNFVNTNKGIMLEPLLILCFQSRTYQMPPKHGLSGVAGYNQQMKPKKHKNPWSNFLNFMGKKIPLFSLVINF
jgi:hypothetical protein